MQHDIVFISSAAKTIQLHACVQSVLTRAMPFILVGSKLPDLWTRIISHTFDYEMFYVVVFYWEQLRKEPNVNWINQLFMVGKHIKIDSRNRRDSLVYRRSEKCLPKPTRLWEILVQRRLYLLYSGRRPCTPLNARLLYVIKKMITAEHYLA